MMEGVDWAGLAEGRNKWLAVGGYGREPLSETSECFLIT
jgi:hypothetical protein